MKKIIAFGICIFILSISTIIANAAQQDVYILILQYNKGEISPVFMNKAKGYFHEQVSQPENAYHLEVISLDGKILYTQKFDFQLEVIFSPLPEWFDEKGNQIYIPNESETRAITDKAAVEFILPYFDDAQRIDVYDKNDELKLSIPLKEKQESNEIQKVVSENAESNESNARENNQDSGVLLGSALATLLVGAFIFEMIIRKRRKEYLERR